MAKGQVGQLSETVPGLQGDGKGVRPTTGETQRGAGRVKREE